MCLDPQKISVTNIFCIQVLCRAHLYMIDPRKLFFYLLRRGHSVLREPSLHLYPNNLSVFTQLCTIIYPQRFDGVTFMSQRRHGLPPSQVHREYIVCLNRQKPSLGSRMQSMSLCWDFYSEDIGLFELLICSRKN